MAPESTGRSDPLRTISLLWGIEPTSSRRGPKQRLDIRQIAFAAIHLADEGDLDSVSMRRVAERLQTSPMALYTYTPSRGDLIDAMVDTVMGKTLNDGTSDDGLPWQAQLADYARRLWSVHLTHPWLLQIGPARATLGPNETKAYELIMSIVLRGGFVGRTAAAVADLVIAFTRGAAFRAASAAAAAAESGQSDIEWWAQREPIFTKMFDADQFPSLVQLHADGAFEADGAHETYELDRARSDFEFGLERVIAGLAAGTN